MPGAPCGAGNDSAVDFTMRCDALVVRISTFITLCALPDSQLVAQSIESSTSYDGICEQGDLQRAHFPLGGQQHNGE